MNKWLTHGVRSNIKLFFIGFLALVMLIPLLFIGGVVNDRQSYSEEAVEDISVSWGQAQDIVGPVLVIPYQIHWHDEDKAPKTSTKYFFALPNTLAIDGTIQPQRRNRGIYQAILYTTKASLSGSFPAVKAQTLLNEDPSLKPEWIQWHKAFLAIQVSSLQGLTSSQRVHINQQPQAVEPGQYFGGLQVALNQAQLSNGFNYNADLNINGSQRLQFSPVGKTTTVALASPWESPSFNGSFLPVNHTITKQGFSANWDVSYFARSFSQQWQSDNVSFSSASRNNFGVSLIDTVDFYRQIERVVKYGILFFALTFLTFFIFEVVAGVSVHIFQYILVGLALSLFYLLLLALAEIIGFGLAYLIASIAIIGLITYYTSGFIKAKKQLTIVVTVLSALYLYLFAILRLEDYSLLFGSIGLFIALATLMAVTRNIDWAKKDDTNGTE